MGYITTVTHPSRRTPFGVLLRMRLFLLRSPKTLSARLGAAGFFFGLGFDRLHVIVAQAEMMADLVDQHVAHDVRQVFARFAPVVEDRTAVEEDAVDVVGDMARAALHHRHALIETEQVERRVELHLLLDLVGWEVVDLDADVADMPTELLGNRRERL